MCGRPGVWKREGRGVVMMKMVVRVGICGGLVSWMCCFFI